ncbi:MAG: protein kinase [Streptosporangiales bacterium]|nr:protein kinase [Streptosporangiales bacterium]
MAGEFPSGWAGRKLAELSPGTLIGGYRIEERIGAGGMATVFRARDESLGRPVALKVLQSALVDDKEFRERFFRESRAASAVDHPNIIPVHAAGEDSGVLYLAMRYVAGGDLHSVVEREGALPSDRVLSLLTPVASALDAAHGAGIVHRDVKPANILIDHSPGRPDHPYLSDFGLAKGSAAHTLTNTGEFVGTAGFASPEQLSGRPVTAQTDQYALACVAYTVLTASLPFRHGDPEAALWAQMSSPPPRVTDRRTDLFPAVDDVIARALSKDPSERYASCGEFASELRQALVAPAGGGRLPTKQPTRLPGRFSHQADQNEPTEPPEAPRHPGLPSDIARPPTLTTRPAPPPTSRPAPAPGMVPLHDAPGQHRRPARNAGGKSRRKLIVVGAGIIVVAVVAGGIALLSGGDGPSGAGAAPAPKGTGPVHLTATLPSSDGKSPVSMAFGPGGTISSADQSGLVSTFNIASQRAANSFSLGTGTAGVASAQLTLDGSRIVRPAAACTAVGCPYAASSATGPGAVTRIHGGPVPVFSVGYDTMADSGDRGTGVNVWNVKTGEPVAKGLASPDHGVVKAAAMNPKGGAVAVSSGASGTSHHVYWWSLRSGTPGPVATETVPASMGLPWASPGVNGLPMGLTGQTLALSDGQTTDIYRALPNQPAQAQKYNVLGGLMAISPDNGNLVATTDQNSASSIDLTDAGTGQRTATLNLPAAPASVVFNADGTSVAVGCANGDIYVWSITGS